MLRCMAGGTAAGGSGKDRTMKPNRKRLEKVIEAVEKASGRQFDMAYWKTITDCGTVACAVGHYVLDNPKCGMRIIGSSLSSSTYFGMDAVAVHFRVTYEQAERLFAKNSYSRPTRAYVLRRLRAFVAKLPA